MITKIEVLTKINDLLTYSNSQAPQYQSKFSSLMQPLIDAVNNYFGIVPEGMKKALDEYVFQTYCDTYSRNVIYSDPIEDVQLPTDFPTGYDDVRQCFYQFTSLLGVTEADFYAAWVIGVPEGGEGGVTQTPEPLNNTYLDAWTPEVTSAPQDDVSRVNAVVEWCKNAADGLIIPNLLEDQGNVVSSKEQQEIARIIYMDRGLMEVIQSRGYNVYIPTYLRTSTTLVKG